MAVFRKHCPRVTRCQKTGCDVGMQMALWDIEDRIADRLPQEHEGTMQRTDIRILETIHLRLARIDTGELAEVIAEVAQAADEEGVRVYRHSRIETDLLVHLHREVDAGGEGPSELGARLVSQLRDHGIVEHSVWIQHPGRTA